MNNAELAVDSKIEIKMLIRKEIKAFARPTICVQIL